MDDDNGGDSNAEQAVKDENNNEIVNDGEEVPDGADNIEVHKRVNAEEVAENIEKIEDSDDGFVRCIESRFDNGYWMIFSCLNLEELNQFTDDFLANSQENLAVHCCRIISVSACLCCCLNRLNCFVKTSFFICTHKELVKKTTWKARKEIKTRKRLLKMLLMKETRQWSSLWQTLLRP